MQMFAWGLARNAREESIGPARFSNLYRSYVTQEAWAEVRACALYTKMAESEVFLMSIGTF